MNGTRGYLIDLDGTLISGGALLPGAAEFFARLGERCAIVSNDAEHTPMELARRLRKIGLPADPARIVLAGTTAIDVMARSRPGTRVLMLASPSLMRYAAARGLQPVAENCNIVFVGRDRRFSYAKIASAAAELAAGAELWLACPDASHRGQQGRPVPEPGALAAAIIACAGSGLVPRVIGKPEPALFERGCACLGILPHHAVMIGDNPATDGQGARRIGMGFLHVQPGDLHPRLLNGVLEMA